jgi:hypothetical protein
LDITTLTKLQDYINEETYHARVYEALSKVAPSEASRNILADLTNDENKHVNMLSSIVKDDIGRDYKPQIGPVFVTASSYRDLLKKQILQEITAFRNFERDFDREEDDSRLKDAYREIKTDALVFITNLLYLLEEE